MKRIAALLAILCSLLPSALRADQTLLLSSSYYPPITSPQRNGAMDLIYQELSRRTGINIEIQNLAAAERVLLNVNAGVDDGDVGRILGLEKKYPNIIRIPVPVMHFQMVVFSRVKDFSVTSPDSIKPYNVGIVRGWKILETVSEGAKSVTVVANGEQLFSMLEKSRIDIALLEKLQGMELIRKMGLQGIKVLQPSLLEGNWYPYVNKKYENLIPLLTTNLRTMEEDGTIKRIHESVLKRYAQ